jgi:hypothetical protein
MKKKDILLCTLAVVLAFTVPSCDGGVSPVNKSEDSSFKLDAELRNRIIQDYFNQVVKPISIYASLEDFEIKKEYGVFDGHVVVGFNRYFVTPGMREVEIGGVMFCVEIASFMIVVWKDGWVHTLISAQENNILSQASLREIALTDFTPLFQL